MCAEAHSFTTTYCRKIKALKAKLNASGGTPEERMALEAGRKARNKYRVQAYDYVAAEGDPVAPLADARVATAVR